MTNAQTKTLADYLAHLKTDNIVLATQEARIKAGGLLNDQGISSILYSIPENLDDSKNPLQQNVF